ncbi:hypothetical protein [Pseudomonas phage Itty13]|uniref:Uncharacterized protein n=1 Tax=Pseudomonas phage Itty13 TaxID=2805750 RepID=A0A889IRC0_9CAUD|nr:hypothetical protein PQC19_gp78 [Pseudomonas phage Itty13]QRE00654.1 hypothetical protein [Pseudomonas phage Itty13]
MKNRLDEINRSILLSGAIAWGSGLIAAMVIGGGALALPLIKSLIGWQWGCHF